MVVFGAAPKCCALVLFGCWALTHSAAGQCPFGFLAALDEMLYANGASHNLIYVHAQRQVWETRAQRWTVLGCAELNWTFTCLCKCKDCCWYAASDIFIIRNPPLPHFHSTRWLSTGQCFKGLHTGQMPTFFQH